MGAGSEPGNGDAVHQRSIEQHGALSLEASACCGRFPRLDCGSRYARACSASGHHSNVPCHAPQEDCNLDLIGFEDEELARLLAAQEATDE